jgi:hypothetical protein
MAVAAMNSYLGMADLRVARLQHLAGLVWVVAVNRTGLCLCNMRDNGEAGDAAAMPKSGGLGKLAGRNSFLPN